ncbi:MAG: porin family protein [Bacteroides sp.]|nr:porin family protein [Bacteroides sp.]
MKIRILLVLASLLMVYNANAQFRFGVEAGVNVSHAMETTGTKAGYNVGVTADYSFSNNIFIESALKLSSQPYGDSGPIGTYYWDNLKNEMEEYCSESVSPNYLILPIRLGYSFILSDKCRLSLSAGPTFGVGLFGRGNLKYTGPADGTVEKEKIKNIFDNEDGRELSRFEVGGSFRLGFTFREHYCIGGEYNIMRVTGEHRPFTHINVFAVNVGYKF